MLLNNLYFRLRPLIPRRIRIGIRRALALRKLEQVGGSWPIMPGSEQPPPGWPGWPEGKQFALVLTHDVEGPAGLDRVKDLAELEIKYGFRSCFNFIPEGPYSVPPTLRSWLVDHGFEVAVHDLHHDGKLFRSRQDFERRVPRINHYLKEWRAVGFRSGFMLRRSEWLHDLEIQYDSSTFDTDPFEPEPQGVNTIFPFWVPLCSTRASISHQGATLNHCQSLNSHPSALNEPRSGYVELPYTLPQDSTLFLLLRERTPRIWKLKLDWIAQRGGMVLMNVHPDYILFPSDGRGSAGFPLRVFEDFLSHLSKEYRGRYWNAMPHEIAAGYSHVLADNRSIRARRPSFRPGCSDDLTSKRVAVVLYSYYPSDPRPRRAAESLIHAGMSVDLFCLRETDNEPQRETINGVNVRRLPIERKRGNKTAYLLQYSLFLVSSTLLLARHTFIKKFDIVHTHNMPDFLAFSALIPKLFGAKVILDLHDPMPELMQSIYRLPHDHWVVKLLTRLERWSIRFADKVLTPNIAFRDLFVSRGCPPEKISIVMNSPQAELFDPKRFKAVANVPDGRNGSFKLMFHGLIAPRHGLDTAIQAVSRLRTEIRGLEFHIFGDRTAYMDEMTKLIRELDLQQSVIYHGQKTQGEIAQALAYVDLGIIPNRRSPFTEINMPTRIFENLAMGKPVIVPNTKGIRDYFNESQIVFFDPGSADSLAKAIHWVYRNPDATKRLVEQGRRVLQVHTWDLERERFLENVRRLLAA